MTDLTPLFQAIITLIAAIITAFLIPYIKSKASAEQLKQIETWVKVAVQAAEQLYTTPQAGEIKKQYVIDFLTSKGYTVDMQKIDALIEATVFSLNKK